jgi:hypothetical protein
MHPLVLRFMTKLETQLSDLARVDRPTNDGAIPAREIYKVGTQHGQAISGTAAEPGVARVHRGVRACAIVAQVEGKIP